MQRKRQSTDPGTEVSIDSSRASPTETLKLFPEKPLFLVLFLTVFRIANALICTTTFVPDEYWQSLEVAHNMAFGYGYLTWEWQKALRGYTHPLAFAVLYKILDILNIDWPYLVVTLPRVLQALLAACSDFYVFKLTALQFKSKASAQYALLCNLVSWFTFYCITRTLSNSVEASLMPIIFYYQLLATETVGKRDLQRNTRVFAALAAVSFLIRPTGAVVWAPLVLLHIVRSNQQSIVLKQIILVGLLTLVWSVLVDWYFYGKFVVVQLNFFLFNVFEGHSAVYGTHPWHWYFTQGVPVMVFTSLPLCLLGVWWSRGSQRIPFWLSLWLVVAHSFLGHKEFRFVFAIVPIASVYAGHCIRNLFHGQWTQQCVIRGRCVKGLVFLLLLVHVPIAFYLSLIHQRGAIAVMDFLRKDIDSNSFVLFLMPCHSTPYYSHIHQGIPMKFLECPPPIDPTYVDQAEEFHSNPPQWLNSHYGSSQSYSSLPTHLVMFNTQQEKCHQFLLSKQYREDTRLFHTHFPADNRFGTHVIVFRKQPEARV